MYPWLTGPKDTEEGYTQLIPAIVVGDLVGVVVDDPFDNAVPVGDCAGDGEAVGDTEAVPAGVGVGNSPGR